MAKPSDQHVTHPNEVCTFSELKCYIEEGEGRVSVSCMGYYVRKNLSQRRKEIEYDLANHDKWPQFRLILWVALMVMILRLLLGNRSLSLFNDQNPSLQTAPGVSSSTGHPAPPPLR